MVRPVYLPSAWNSTLSGYYSVLVDGTDYEYQGASKRYSLSAPDANTVRFELRDGDQHWWDADNNRDCERDELAARVTMANNQPIHISYGFTLEPGSPNTAGWMVLGQLHQGLDDGYTAGPAFSIGLDGEHMLIQGHITDSDGKPQTVVYYEDPYNIQRGHQYDIDIKVEFDPTGHDGRLVVTRDGVTIVDYSGMLGDKDMTSSYWAEGVYRDGSATETVAADYSNLQITTGSTVKFPSASAFVPAPKMTTSHIEAVPGATGHYAVALSGTAKAGATVSIYENQKLVGSGVADSSGHVVVNFISQTAGTHSYNAVAIDKTGASGPVSSGFDVAIGTAAQIVAEASTLNTDSVLTGALVTDTHVLSMPDANTLSKFVHYGALVGDLQSTVMLQRDYAVLGKTWDREIDTYSSTGTVVSQQRLAAGKVVQDTVNSGSWSQTRTINTDGSYTISTSNQSVVKQSTNFDVSGHKTSSTLHYDSGGTKTDSYATNGSVSKDMISPGNGTTLTTYTVTGKSYATQRDFTSGGKIVAQGQYDSAGHLLFAKDLIKGTTTTYSWNGSGHVTSYKMVASDGTYTVTTLASDGTSVVKTDHFSAKGVHLSADTSDPGAIAQAAITKDSAAALGFAASATATLPSATVAATLGTTTATIVSASSAASTTDSGFDVTVKGTGKLGTQVTVYDGSTAVGNAAVDASGHFAATFAVSKAGTHAYTVAPISAAGVKGAASAAVSLDMSAAAPVAEPEPTPAQTVPSTTTTPTSTSTATTPSPAPAPAPAPKPAPTPTSPAQSALGPGSTIEFSSTHDVLAYIKAHAADASAAAPVLLHSNAAIKASGYDHQAVTYDLSGTLLQSQHYLNGVLVKDIANVGTSSATLNVQTSGTASLEVQGASKAHILIGYDATGHETSQQIFFDDGSKRVDAISSTDGHVTSSTTYNADGTRLQVGYTASGQTSWLNVYNKSGAAIDQVRYDASGHVTMLNDIANKQVASFNYDANGHALTAKLTQADGSYSVTTYAGDFDHVSKVDYYSAKKVLLSETHTDPVQAMLHQVDSAVTAADAHTSQGMLYTDTVGETLTAKSDTMSLVGGAGADVLVGNGNDQVLIGGGGSNVMTGGGGNDLFYFTLDDLTSAGKLNSERITDFSQGDRIDLSSLENSISNHAGFDFIGTGAFGGHAGELRVFDQGGNTIVAGDLNGDKTADFTIQLDGHHILSSTDFLL